MSKVEIYFEIFGLATDEDGNPDYAGMKLTLGEIEEKIDYEKLTKNINLKGILEMAMLDKLYDENDIRVISPEEYRKKYGEVE